MNYTLQGYIDCGLNTENFEKKFTDNASWERPQHREFRKEILQAMQVGRGAPIGFPFSTGNASLC